MHRTRHSTRFALHAAVLATALGGTVFVGGCGDNDDDGLDPGGSTFRGNVSVATTAAVETERSLLRRFAELLLPWRTAHAQIPDTTLGDITVTVVSNRERTDITDANGQFVLFDAPTGETTVIFRRGGCQASFPISAVVSGSTITLTNVNFQCNEATPDNIHETFRAVLRDEPSGTGDDLDLCVRVGDDQRLRSAFGGGAVYRGANGETRSFDDLEDDDLLEIDGDRSGFGAPDSFFVEQVRILERNVNDPCDDDPLT